jgi:3-dehydroquinate synthase
MSDHDKTNHLDIPFSAKFIHRIRFTDDVLGNDQATLAEILAPSGNRQPRVQFWVDEDVARTDADLVQKIHSFSDSYADHFFRIGNVQKVPGGETIKNDIHILERMLKVFHVSDLDRRSYVVVFGGGAVLDAVGFAAAIAHRGIRLIRLPTTTLAQADSGVGVKNAVNLFGKKNWIGSFAVPWAVINDAKLLTTLSDRDYICGFSEAVKVALLKDPRMFDNLCEHATQIQSRTDDTTPNIIRQSAEWHLRHITSGGDPFEALEARPLDFGHWSAHKLEAMSRFALRHGEAVAIGLAIDTVYSSMVHGLPKADSRRVLQCLEDLGFDLQISFLSDQNTLLAGLEEFRQHLGGRFTLTMLRGVGEPMDVHQIDRKAMQAAIHEVAVHADAERR